LIAGGTGQLGSDCLQVMGESCEVTALGSTDLDITRLPDVERAVQDFSPDVLVNCAAYNQVDACETEREIAWNVNVKGPENLAACMEKYGGRLIHISTDYVFDGGKRPPAYYLEEDKPNPLSFYGKTKLEGERAVRRTTRRHTILRTAWLYGINGQNFIKTMLRLALKDPDKPVKVVNDQFGSPTWSYRLALQILKTIEAKGLGTYHATAEGNCTWYEFARYFLDKMDVPHGVIPCTSEEYPTPAPRPKNSILENRHLKEEGIHLMVDWQSDLDQYVTEFRERLIIQSR
jgi:dTDP-4-dehydrorhamnose reductase